MLWQTEKKQWKKYSFLCLRWSVVQAPRLRSSNQKLIQILARPKLSCQPARLLATTRPSLLGIDRVAIFGKHFRISALSLVFAEHCAEPLQTLLQFGFLKRYDVGQSIVDLRVKFPKFIQGLLS